MAEAGRALGASRCFVRIGEIGGREIVAEWLARGAAAVAEDGEDLPVSDLVARTEQTVAIVDIDDAPELVDASSGGLDQLHRLGVKSVASTPVRADGPQLGVLTAHRDAAGAWTRGDLALLEAVAVEVGLALRLGRLIDENRERFAAHNARITGRARQRAQLLSARKQGGECAG